jgi:hypothetical protein
MGLGFHGWSLVKKSPDRPRYHCAGGLAAQYNRNFPDTARLAPKYGKIMVIWRHIPYNRRFVFGANKTVSGGLRTARCAGPGAL